MNRIIVDMKQKDAIIKDENITLNIKEDVNLLINDKKLLNYNINIINSNVNILCLFDDVNNLSFNFDINNSNVSFNTLIKNGKNEKINILLNKDSKIDVYNSVIATDKQKVDIFVEHKSSKTVSNIYNCGSTSLDGSISFNVISKVNKKKKNCVVNQDSKIISLNDTNENQINPVLLIDEYNVDARHAAFIGKFNKDELFYLMSRGLNKDEASKLLLDGFLVGIMNISEEEKESLKEKLKMIRR